MEQELENKILFPKSMSKYYTTINVDFISFSEQTYHTTRIRKAVLCPAFTSNTKTFTSMPDAVDEDFLVLFFFFFN